MAPGPVRTLILVAALLGTVVVLLLTQRIHGFTRLPGPRHGPDSAGLGAYYLMVCPVRWLAVAAVVAAGIVGGGFAWSGRSIPVQAVTLLILHFLGGLVSLAALFIARAPSTGSGTTTAALYASDLLPIAVCTASLAGLASTLGAPMSVARLLTAVYAGFVVVGSIAGGIILGVEHRSTLARRAEFNREEQLRADAETREAGRLRDLRLAELRDLSSSTPFVDWLGYLEDPSFEVRTEAGRRIGELPTRDQEITQLLQSPRRALALRYLWLQLPTPPAGLLQPFKDCLATMPEWTRQRLTPASEASVGEVNLACEAIVVIAERFKPEAQFRAGIQSLSGMLEAEFAWDGFRARGLLTGWLDRNGRP